jgi:hypothetical protein
MWIAGFLRRSGLRRRAVSSKDAKNRPSLDAMNERRMLINALCERLGISARQLLNADETGVSWNPAPTHQYTPRDATRASAPQGDDKARFTAMIYGHGDGTLGTGFFIIKCAAKAPDYSATRVLQSLKDQSAPGGKAEDAQFAGHDWELHMWERDVLVPCKGQQNEVKHFKIPYLRSREGHIVTLQEKAWMDTARACMWLELIVGPLALNEPIVVVWDNCGSHNTKGVHDFAKRLCNGNIHLCNLIENTTDLLQPMDLVINAPIEADLLVPRQSPGCCLRRVPLAVRRADGEARPSDPCGRGSVLPSAEGPTLLRHRRRDQPPRAGALARGAPKMLSRRRVGQGRDRQVQGDRAEADLREQRQRAPSGPRCLRAFSFVQHIRDLPATKTTPSTQHASRRLLTPERPSVLRVKRL